MSGPSSTPTLQNEDLSTSHDSPTKSTETYRQRLAQPRGEASEHSQDSASPSQVPGVPGSWEYKQHF